MISRSVDHTMRNSAIAARLDISRRCADNVRNPLASQVPRAAVARVLAKAARTAATQASAIVVDSSIIEHQIVLAETRKSPVGGVALWSGQFVKASSKTMGVLALSGGESELAAVVRAATEGLGLQSILSDFDLCGHVAIKSDECCDWDGPSTRIWKSSTFGCGSSVGSASRSFGEILRLQNVRVRESE